MRSMPEVNGVSRIERENARTDCKRVFLHVNKQNAQAIKTYEKVGFVRTDAKQFDIGQGYVMDDYIYCWG